MSTVYAVANQKGGVGKTTTAVNMAACIAEAGLATMLIDLDPQCNATVGLGLPRDLEPNSYTCLLGESELTSAARPCGVDNLMLVPSTPDLAGATVELPRTDHSEIRLRTELESARSQFDQIVIDCPPSLGPLSVNALVAADRVIVPVQAEYLALEGLAQFLDTLTLIQRELNPQPADRRHAADDARQPHAAGPGCRARAARPLPGAGLQNGHTAQREDQRGAQLRSLGDPSRSALERCRCLLRTRKGGG